MFVCCVIENELELELELRERERVAKKKQKEKKGKYNSSNVMCGGTRNMEVPMVCLQRHNKYNAIL